MKAQKIISTFLAVCMLLGGVTIPGAAVENTSTSATKFQLDEGIVVDLNDTTVNASNAETWAYKDYATADAADKGNILKARSLIMEQTTWAADWVEVSYIEPDGTRGTVPKFNEVFPDWDIEQIYAYQNTVYQISALAADGSEVFAPSSSDINVIWFDADIPLAQVGVNAPYAAQMPMAAGTRTYVTTIFALNVNTVCNIGYTTYAYHGTSTAGYYDAFSMMNVPQFTTVGCTFIDDYTSNDTIYLRLSSSISADHGEFSLTNFPTYGS